MTGQNPNPNPDHERREKEVPEVELGEAEAPTTPAEEEPCAPEAECESEKELDEIFVEPEGAAPVRELGSDGDEDEGGAGDGDEDEDGDGDQDPVTSDNAAPTIGPIRPVGPMQDGGEEEDEDEAGVGDEDEDEDEDGDQDPASSDNAAPTIGPIRPIGPMQDGCEEEDEAGAEDEDGDQDPVSSDNAAPTIGPIRPIGPIQDEDEEAGSAPATTPKKGRPRLALRVRKALEWLPIAFVLPFLVLFVIVVFQRFWVPWEIEWMEGQSATQAWRFAKGMPLYPPASEGWVPYMYAPLYHMLYGWLMNLTGVYSLSLGRLISLLSTFATLSAMYWMVYDRARRAAPALLSALLLLAFFKPSGYWYDIVRIDMMALALGAWGMYFTMKRKVVFWQALLGMLLLTAATFTKQSMGYVAVGCGVCLLFKNPRGAVAGGLVLVLIIANVLFAVSRGANGEFLQYTVYAPYRHPAQTTIYFPGAISVQDFMQNVAGPAKSWEALARLYVKLHFEKGPSPLWDLALRHVWILGGLVLLWLFVCLFRWRKPDGWIYLVPSVGLVWTAIKAYSLYGGYLNNFITLFFAFALLTGFAAAGLRRNTRGFLRYAAMLLVLGIVVAQLYQPWSMPGAGGRDRLMAEWGRDQRKELRNEVQTIIDYNAMSPELRAQRPKPSERGSGLKAQVMLFLSRFNIAGLTYFPSQQLPDANADKAHTALMEWLHQRHLADEPVCVLHHQWYSVIAGHPMTADVDAVRCAQWAGQEVPKTLLDDLRGGKFKYVVVDMPSLQYEWVPQEVREILQRSYTMEPKFPPYDGLDQGALRPVTGAEMAPRFLLKYNNWNPAKQ